MFEKKPIDSQTQNQNSSNLDLPSHAIEKQPQPSIEETKSTTERKIVSSIIPDKSKKISNTDKLANFFREKTAKFISLIFTGLNLAKNEYGSIKEKSKDLLNTNYNLGLKHLERGNIGDAVFRFKFIIKFWPNHYDAYYQLAYCYFLQKRYHRALYTLDLLIKINPDYQHQVQDLRSKLDEIINGQKNG